LSNIISDSNEDPNDSAYKDEEMEEMSVSSDKEEEKFVDLEEILQLQQDLNLPALDPTNDAQKYQHNRSTCGITAATHKWSD
jgi:hypothetical protein